ncbi:alanine/glycine:cation symporter family protein [Nocardioides sp. GY 10127]|uniref:alanine/glycine:cation symporter family protein n=1 Tax=Nocardioides sp. GY 10127 TaxID=2569762 RepID=UPI0010A7516A|nr:alanine/glycine:cation symporter family protein [Nocardioides sp. GY 10127]TIC84054.1 alanine:cation symporter family protein [Nocardioides sp. GY 10127]
MRMTPEVIVPLAADPGVVGRLEDGINTVFEPVATAATSVVFWEVPLGDYSFPLIVLWLVVAAAVFTVYFRGIQFRSWRTSWALVRGRYSRASDPGEVTHFQALASAVSGTVGLGNIAGVAVAVTVGGPGATFWMILAGLLGMCTKFVECTLGVKYREVHEDGTVSGGPFRYLPVAFERFGATASRIGVGIFAVALILFGALGGNAFQANQTFAQAREITGGEDGLLGSSLAALLFGLLLAAGVGVVILGGVTSIARVTSKLVPFMAGLYVLACLAVIIGNLGQVPGAFATILSSAFSPDGIAGGAIGVLIVGFQRAAFSNEAGVGSAPIVHSAVKTRHPVTEGFVALLEPFIDTVVICTMTALTIVIADTDLYGSLLDDAAAGKSITNDAGVVLTSRSFDSILPGFDAVLTVAVALFAFSTLLTWSYYTLKAWTTLVGRSPVKENAFKAIFCVFTVLGAVVDLGQVLNFADAMLFVCAVVNLIACYLLLPVVKREVIAFVGGLRSGEIAEVPQAERATT